MFANDKNYRKIRDRCHFTDKYRGAVHSICNLRFSVPMKFLQFSNFDYHFIIKELANEFQGQFECLWENTEKQKILSLPIEKEIRKVDKDGNEDIITSYYKIKSC